MRQLINRANAERMLSALYSGAHARLWLVGLMTACVAAAVDLATAAIFAGAALLIEEAYKMLQARMGAMSARQAKRAHTVLDTAASASLAAAPALVWSAHGAHSGSLAALMLAMLTVNAAFAATRGRLRALVVCAPYGALALFFLADACRQGLGPAAAIACVSAYIFAAALHQAHRARHARALDLQWLRQLDAGFADPDAAAWEIDFAHRRLIGAERLSALLGRMVTFDDIVSGGFAAPADRELVQTTLTPGRGAARRIALEHELNGGGRVRHTAFVRSTPDGAPASLACITRVITVGAADELGAAIAAQASHLRTLCSEFSARQRPPEPAARFAG